MCRLTHVLWSILDKELDSYDYFTIGLNLNEKMRKSIQGQVKKVKKGQIFKIYFFENKDMFLKQNLLSNPMLPLVFL